MSEHAEDFELDKITTSLPWEESIIGRTEKFMVERFKFHPMWARALGTILVTAPLGNVDKYTFNDGFGACYANPFFIYIGRSGLAIKTPPIKMIKRILYGYNKNVISPSSFNPESFGEYVQGTDGMMHGKQTRKPIPPHPINLCIADEASRILGEMKNYTYQQNLMTFLSKLWDGEIEGKYTRGHQNEGNIEVFFSLLAATSKDFYRLLDRPFFTQGLGNRILWVVEEKFTAMHLDSEKFFFGNKHDDEFVKLEEFTIDCMRKLDNCVSTFMSPSGAKTWTDYANKWFDDIAAMTDDSEAEYCAKVPLNVLKLSICYAASRLNVDKMGMIWIASRDVKMAINDATQYFRMWKLAMRQWSEFRGDDEKNEDRLKTSKYDVMIFVHYAIENGGKICASEIAARGAYPDRMKIGERLNLGLTMGLLEVANRPQHQDLLTDAELLHYKKICGGNIPCVWRVTKLGMEKCKV